MNIFPIKNYFEFIQSHIIEATDKVFDDFAGGSTDPEFLKKILNL